MRDTRKGKQRLRLPKYKYHVEDEDRIKYFYKSRQSKDRQGNNSAHFAFMIEDPNLRRKFLDLILEEELGDVEKRNILSLLPEEMLHNFTTDQIAPQFHSEFVESVLEKEEADYLIITSQSRYSDGNKKIVVSQLEELGFKIN